MERRSRVLWLAVGLVAVGCGTPDAGDMAAEQAIAAEDPQQVWWERMQGLCGQSFQGTMARYDEELDAGWLNREIVIHVRHCTPDEIHIPLHVGENRSRIWMLTRTEDGIRLKHDHRHPDGTEEASTQYGGDTVAPGTDYRQAFPADDYSRALFEAQDHPDGVHNVWIMEIHPGERFTYNLTRFNRDFAADFDLRRPVDAPPPPWAVQPADADAHHDHAH